MRLNTDVDAQVVIILCKLGSRLWKFGKHTQKN